MATTRTAIGRVQPVYRGDYIATSTYYKLDNVLYNNSTWVCKVDNISGILPAIENSTYWQKVAGQGNTGGFGTPTASASYLSPGTNPTVNVSVDPESPNTSKVFVFDFGIPAGPTGPVGIETVVASATNWDSTGSTILTASDPPWAVVALDSSAQQLSLQLGIPPGHDGQGAVSSVDGYGPLDGNVQLGAVRYAASQNLTSEQKAQARVNIGAVPMPSNVNINQFLYYNNSGTWTGRSLYEVPFGDTTEDVNKFLKKGENDSLTWQTIYQIPAAPSGIDEGAPLVKASGESHAVTWGSVISSSDIDSIFNES